MRSAQLDLEPAGLAGVEGLVCLDGGAHAVDLGQD
jgi:hypothetical protein